MFSYYNKNGKCGKHSTTAAAVDIGSKQKKQEQRSTEHNSPPPHFSSVMDTTVGADGNRPGAELTVFGPLQDYPAAGAGVALEGRKIHPAFKLCLHRWEMQRLHFTTGLSTDLDGGRSRRSGRPGSARRGRGRGTLGRFRRFIEGNTSGSRKM